MLTSAPLATSALTTSREPAAAATIACSFVCPSVYFFVALIWQAAIVVTTRATVATVRAFEKTLLICVDLIYPAAVCKDRSRGKTRSGPQLVKPVSSNVAWVVGANANYLYYDFPNAVGDTRVRAPGIAARGGVQFG